MAATVNGSYGTEEKETMPALTTTRRRGDEGFALILALLALMLLTFLGLTLATTTSTELQIATNYRWSQQALYNAEAGLEAGKVYLRNVPGNWGAILPVARTVPWTAAVPNVPANYPTGPAGLATVDSLGRALRHWENRDCDQRGAGAGYGVVLNDPGATPSRGPFQYVTTTLGQSLNGSFTLWARRDVSLTDNGNIVDNTSNTVLVLTAEGVAPYLGSQMGTAIGRRNAAVRVLEVTVSRATGVDTCESYRGQSGGGVSGSGFWNCGVMGGGTGGCAAAAGLQTAVGQPRRGATQTTGNVRVATDDAGTLCDTGVR
jgi:hypothetical protein